MTDPIKHKVDQSEALIRCVDRLLDGLEMSSELRFRLAGACLHVALDHHKAIVLLVAHRIYSTAFALVRLLLDSYVRGVWLHRCATEAEVRLYEADTHKKSFDDLVGEIEKLEAFNDGVLLDLKKKHWRAMNSFAHSGALQAQRHNTSDTIEQKFDADEVVTVIQGANFLGLLAANEIAALANEPEVANKILEQMKKLAT